MMKRRLSVIVILALTGSVSVQGAERVDDGSVLPFPESKQASTTGKTLKDAKHKWRKAENHLPKDTPNIVIFMTDDAGFSNSETFGGPVHMSTMARLAKSGISYNEFHTTAMCSPTRASLLTGRNHHRVGAGQIAELASDWDGYVGKIPKSTTTFPQVLSYYGYNTAAFGKWHNTPVTTLQKWARLTVTPQEWVLITSTDLLQGKLLNMSHSFLRIPTLSKHPMTPNIT